ncbi:MAG: hypothetical protein V3T29_00915, partial [Alphaproteobacteria bacterium]
IIPSTTINPSNNKISAAMRHAAAERARLPRTKSLRDPHPPSQCCMTAGRAARCLGTSGNEDTTNPDFRYTRAESDKPINIHNGLK